MADDKSHNKPMNIDLTKGSVFKTLIRFSWPLMLANLLVTLYNLTDMLMAGHFLGKEAMSAISAGGQMSFLLTTASMGISAGGQIIISQQKGAKQTDSIDDTAGSLFIFSLVAGALLSVIGYLFAPLVLKLLNTPSEAFEQATDYMRVTSWGLIFVFSQNAVSAIFRGFGQSKIPLSFAFVSALLNALLNYIFLKCCEFGIWGISLSTVISQAASFLLALIFLIKHRGDFRLAFSSFGPNVWKIIKIGVPFGSQLAVVNLANMYITAGVNSYGIAASAALGAGVRITNLLTIPMMAVGNGATTMVGQNMGAGHSKRSSKAVKCALLIMLCISALTISLCQLFPGDFVRIFNSDENVISIGSIYLKTVSWCFIGHSCHSAYNAAVLGVGFSFYSLFASVAEAFVGRVLITYLLAKIMGLYGIFLSQAASPYISGLIAGLYFHSGKWEKHKILDNNQNL